MESLESANTDQAGADEEVEKQYLQQIANLNGKLKCMQEESNFNLQKIKQLNDQKIRKVEEHNLKVHKLKQITKDLNDAHKNSVLAINDDLRKKRKKIEALKIVLKNREFQQLPSEKIPPNKLLELEQQTADNDMLLRENNELKTAIDKQINYLISLEKKLNNLETLLKNNSNTIDESNRKIEISKLEHQQNLTQIESLQEELFDKNIEWAIFTKNINPIINQKESLFDEVNNKRLTLQEKVNEIKQLSIEMKLKLMKNEKIIRDIKKSTVELNSWKKYQLEQIENDNYEMLYHFKQRKQILESELIRRQNFINLEDDVQKFTESEKTDEEIFEKSLNNLQLIKSRLTQLKVQTQNEIRQISVEEGDNNSSVIKEYEPTLQNNNSTIINITHNIKKEELSNE